MDFEDVLKPVGLFSAYQKRLVYLFLIPVTICGPLLTMSTFFLILTPDHWCYVPELSHLSPELQRNLSVPPEMKQGLWTHSNCYMYDLNYTRVGQTFNQSSPETLREDYLDGKLGTRSCSHGWHYDRKNVQHSAVTELNLVCEKQSWPAYILTLDGIGRIMGNPLLGYSSDYFGRRPGFFLTVAVAILSCFSPLVIQTYPFFAVFRFINGWILPTIFQIPYIILTEIVGVQYRVRMVAVAHICWSIGMCLVPLIAYYAHDWYTLSIYCVVVGCANFIYIFFLPESPRWLISQKRFSEALKILTACAKVNKREVPENYLHQIKKVGTKLSEEGTGKISVKELIGNKVLRINVLLITYAWIANFASYYGTLFNFQNLAGNPYLNFFLLAAAEFPSEFMAWYFMETRLGRRWTAALCMALAGLSYCIPLAFPPSWATGMTVLTMAGRCLGNVSFVTLYQIAAEVFPTPLRNQGLGLCSAIAAILNFVLPHIAVLGRINVKIPLLITGVICLSAGVTTSFLPETLNTNLPQNVSDCEDIKSKTKYFSLANTKIKDSAEDEPL